MFGIDIPLKLTWFDHSLRIPVLKPIVWFHGQRPLEFLICSEARWVQPEVNKDWCVNRVWAPTSAHLLVSHQPMAINFLFFNSKLDQIEINRYQGLFNEFSSGDSDQPIIIFLLLCKCFCFSMDYQTTIATIFVSLCQKKRPRAGLWNFHVGLPFDTGRYVHLYRSSMEQTGPLIQRHQW